MILLVLALAVGPIELRRPIDPLFARDVARSAKAQDLSHVGERGHLMWYSARYYPLEKVENWGRDTLVVVTTDGRVFKAQEQFAVTPDHRMVPLSGLVPNSDLQRLSGKRGMGVVVLVGFRDRFSLQSVAEVKVGRSTQ